MRLFMLTVFVLSLFGAFETATSGGASVKKNEQKKEVPKEEEGYAKVEVKSKLLHVVQEGPTELWRWNGWSLYTGRLEYILDFGDNKDWPELAKKNTGKWVVVTGNLRQGRGYQFSPMTYIDVATFKICEEKKK